jgi:peptidoglycan-associated lipoprotein
MPLHALTVRHTLDAQTKGGASMEVRRSQVALVLLSMLLASACAKRPAMTQAAAPPPTGAAVTAPAPAPAPPPPAPVTPLAPPAAPPPVAAAPPAPAPAPPRPEPAEFKSIPELRDVFFDFDRYALKPEGARTLDASIEWLKANPSALVLIEGHCDERGTNAYNLALGERRAKAAHEYLVARGVAATRIQTISYGEERPDCTERNESCWSRNRRAHFLAKQP